LIRKKFEEETTSKESIQVNPRPTRSLIFKEKVNGKLTPTPSSVNFRKQPANAYLQTQLIDSYGLGNMSRLEGTKSGSKGKRKYDIIDEIESEKTANFSPKKIPKIEKIVENELPVKKLGQVSTLALGKRSTMEGDTRKCPILKPK